MNRILTAFAGALLCSACVAHADVGVSINIGEPGFYGRIELGDMGRPPVVYSRPVIIERRPRVTVVEPIYLRVPPGQAKNWRKHCARYDACGRPVYFVRDDWYSTVYAPRYREQHRERQDERQDRREDRRDDRRDDRRN